jgi:hypothetical protein
MPDLSENDNGLSRANPPDLRLKPRSGTWEAGEIRRWAANSLRSMKNKSREVALGVALLWHDHWDEAHAIAQSREGQRDFDWLHAVLHRREGDFGNAAYWFRSAGRHPAFAFLPDKILSLLADCPGQKASLLPKGTWSPEGFLRAVRENPEDAALRAVQAEELFCLYDWVTKAD